MADIVSRLAKIEARLTDKDFLKNRGLGNDLAYIFDYSPRNELLVRNHIAYLKGKINKFKGDLAIVEFDLYNIVIAILKERGYLQKCFAFEKTKGLAYVFEAITKVLMLTNKSNLLVKHIVENTPPNAVIFITGVGKCFPFVRSHNVLNNLHQVLDNVPVVMFFPGKYSGQNFQPFGTIKDGNYYRALKLC